MDFEFGETSHSYAFLKRNPKFLSAFIQIVGISNKFFDRPHQPNNLTEDVCFNLAHTCREDFCEISFLVLNGYGIAGSKLLRGLYERAVSIAYLMKNPDKARRFLDFAAVQENKAMKRALAVISEEEFDKDFAPKSVKRIRDSFAAVKEQFQVTACEVCQTKRPSATWDIDFSSMVDKVGPAYKQYYIAAYEIPNFQLHATLASALPDHQTEELTAERNRDSGVLALATAMLIFLLVLRSQDQLFTLNLGMEIDACEKVAADVGQQFEANRLGRTD
jgi:hypothetical protein